MVSAINREFGATLSCFGEPPISDKKKSLSPEITLQKLFSCTSVPAALFYVLSDNNENIPHLGQDLKSNEKLQPRNVRLVTSLLQFLKIEEPESAKSLIHTNQKNKNTEISSIHETMGWNIPSIKSQWPQIEIKRSITFPIVAQSSQLRWTITEELRLGSGLRITDKQAAEFFISLFSLDYKSFLFSLKNIYGERFTLRPEYIYQADSADPISIDPDKWTWVYDNWKTDKPNN